jgi:hypothetical protein
MLGKKSKTRKYLEREGIDPDRRCIPAEEVPCPDARASLKKKGMLCDVKPDAHTPKPKKRKSKGFLERWFG